jgi:hypothetical protein
VDRFLEGVIDLAELEWMQSSFALVAKAGKTARMLCSLDRPLRYFLRHLRSQLGTDVERALALEKANAVFFSD